MNLCKKIRTENQLYIKTLNILGSYIKNKRQTNQTKYEVCKNWKAEFKSGYICANAAAYLSKLTDSMHLYDPQLAEYIRVRIEKRKVKEE